MSGDMNTSLGNKLLMCFMAKAYIDSLNIKVEFVNNGDDCLMITERKHLTKLDTLESYFKDFGFNIVREKPVYVFEKVEFCQSKPVYSNGIWRMTRNVKTCLIKDLTCLTLGHNENEYRKWLKDVGACGLATAHDVPILGAFYRMLDRMGVDGKYSGSWDNEFKWHKLSSRNVVSKNLALPDPEARCSFWLSTDISPDQQLVVETYFNQVDWGINKRQLIDKIHYLIQ